LRITSDPTIRCFTDAKMKRRLAQINESIERYLRSMDSADRAEPEIAQLKRGRLQEKIEALKEQMARLKEIDTQMRAAKSNTSVTPGSR
jgi:HPt (histidine-containing phosphotransfer) domain-containing protein